MTMARVDGGDGLWRTDGRAWTRSDGAFNGPFNPIPTFAVFQGAAGTVTVDDNAISVTGMQFATDGYEVTGNPIALADPVAVVRVGDGTAAGANMVATISSALTGSAGLTKTDLGTLVLAGDNSYSGGTIIAEGTLRLGAAQRLADSGAVIMADQATFDLAGFDETVGSFDGAGEIVLGGGVLTTGADMDSLFAGTISGAGGLIKQGAGALILTGDSSSGFTGMTNVTGGDLRINGALGGQAQIGAGATLSGIGTLGGPVSVAAGGRVAPGDNNIGTLSVGSLILAGGAHLDFELSMPDVVGGAANDLINVTRNLRLDGTLNITDPGRIDAGVYRLINYGGALTNNGLDFGLLPDGLTPADLFVQTSVANQVNLNSSVGAELSIWDGADPAHHDNGVVDGGDGVWRVGGRAWTRPDGAINGSYRPNPTFAVFQGAEGTVSVDNSAGAISVTGMQFVTDGFEVTGDPIALAGANAVIRVGERDGGRREHGGNHFLCAYRVCQLDEDGSRHLGSGRRQQLFRRHNSPARHLAPGRSASVGRRWVGCCGRWGHVRSGRLR